MPAPLNAVKNGFTSTSYNIPGTYVLIYQCNIGGFRYTVALPTGHIGVGFTGTPLAYSYMLNVAQLDHADVGKPVLFDLTLHW